MIKSAKILLSNILQEKNKNFFTLKKNKKTTE